MKDKAAAAGSALRRSTRCDGFFNEAAPAAGKWTNWAVAAAEQIANSFVCEINDGGLRLHSLPLRCVSPHLR